MLLNAHGEGKNILVSVSVKETKENILLQVQATFKMSNNKLCLLRITVHAKFSEFLHPISIPSTVLLVTVPRKKMLL